MHTSQPVMHANGLHIFRGDEKDIAKQGRSQPFLDGQATETLFMHATIQQLHEIIHMPTFM